MGKYELKTRSLPDSSLVWQRETEYIAASANRHVLHAIYGVGHRRSAEGLTGVEVPEGLAVFSVNGFEGFRIVAKEDEASGRGESSPP